MKKFSLGLIILLLILIGVLVFPKDIVIKPIQVFGDLDDVFDVSSLYENQPDLFDTLSYKDVKMKAIDGADLYSYFPTIFDENFIYLISYDGFMNRMDSDALKDTYFGYTKEYGWVFHSEHHPPNSGIKNIEMLLVVNKTDETNLAYGLNIINNETKETHHFSMGDLYLKPFRQLNYLDGVSEKSVDGVTYKVPGMKIKKVLQIDDLIEDSFELQLMMTAEGDYEYFSSKHGYIELAGNQLNYILPESYKIYNDLKGVIINPPTASNLDTYDEVLYSLKNEEPVMVIFIDGFSYDQYDYMKRHMKTYLNDIENVSKANTVYKPVTNAGFAAMITGQSPKENGILNRSFRVLQKPDIFDYAVEHGLNSVLIEGDINILDTAVMPILNTDRNKDGFTDGEVFEASKLALETKLDLIMIHFHGLDDSGHDYGPLDERTLNQLQLIDGYIEEIMEIFEGKVIITSDHGMHAQGNNGDHGMFRYEDMMIPYMTIEQK